jgi:hypothetical protein
MNKIACTITDNSISLLLDGRMRVVAKGNTNFKTVEKLIKKINRAVDAWDEVKAIRLTHQLREAVDIPVYIERATAGRVKVTDKGVMFNDQPVHSVIAQQIMRLLDQGHDVTPLAHFLDKVMDNPNGEIANELYQWIEHSKNISLAPDGDFYAYKKVAGDYSSIYRAPDGTKVFNRLGTIIDMPRQDVDGDRERTCSSGLHFCSFDYLASYGHGGEERVVIVKIDPADVVAIPTDYNYSKGRACRYEIVAEVPPEELSPDIFEQAVQVADDTYSLRALLETYVPLDDWEVEDEDYDDDHWREPEEDIDDFIEEQMIEAAITRDEGEPPPEVEVRRVIPVLDNQGKIIRYIEE